MSLNIVKGVYLNSLSCWNKTIKSKGHLGESHIDSWLKAQGKQTEDLQMKLGRGMVKMLETETSTLTSDTMPKVRQYAEHLAGN